MGSVLLASNLEEGERFLTLSRKRWGPRPGLRNALFNYSAFGGFDEADELGDIFTGVGFGAEAFEGLSGVELGSEEDAEGALNFLDAFGRKSTTLETDGIGAISMILARSAGL